MVDGPWPGVLNFFFELRSSDLLAATNLTMDYRLWTMDSTTLPCETFMQLCSTIKIFLRH